MKKVGEVLAFSESYLILLNKANIAARFLWNDDALTSQIQIHKGIISEIKTLSLTFPDSEIVIQKAERTKEKLLAMADMYIKDEWDNPTELLEWLGFFSGAAIVHWSLVAGIADANKIASLLPIIQNAMSAWNETFSFVKNELYETGKRK